jgi:hypothetical protein
MGFAAAWLTNNYSKERPAMTSRTHTVTHGTKWKNIAEREAKHLMEQFMAGSHDPQLSESFLEQMPRLFGLEGVIEDGVLEFERCYPKASPKDKVAVKTFLSVCTARREATAREAVLFGVTVGFKMAEGRRDDK